MLDRQSLIGNLDVGDIFHAEYSNGAKCICLVLSVDGATIRARRVTTQDDLLFDRETGVERDDPERPLAVINSVAPLPPAIHDTFLELDRRYASERAKEKKDQDWDQLKLTDAERSALRFIDSYYSENPI